MFKQHVTRTLVFTILGLVIAAVLALILPKTYEARLEMLLGNEVEQRNSQSAFSRDVEEILNRTSPNSADTERQILNSEAVFFKAFQRTIEKRGTNDIRLDDWVEYFKQYDIVTPRVVGQAQNATVASIRVRAGDPRFATDLANEISFQYNDVRRDNSRKGTEDAIRYLEGMAPIAKKELEEKEQGLKTFKDTNKMADLELTKREAITYKTQLQTQVDLTKRDIQSAEGEVASYRSRIASLSVTNKESDTTVRNPKLQVYETQIAELTAQRARLLQTYLADAEPIKELDQAIAKIEAERAKVIKNDQFTKNSYINAPNVNRRAMEQELNRAEGRLAGLQSQLRELESLLGTQVALLDSMPQKELEITRIDREMNISRQKYETLIAQLGALKDRRETGTQQAVVLNAANAFQEPVAPDLGMYIFLGGVAGFCIGLLTSFIIESLKLRVHTSQQLSELTGLPVVAAVPTLKGAEGRSLRALASANVVPAEAYRYMAFSTLSQDNASKSFAFTSIKNAPGSYAGALQFAKSVAQTGSRVLLIDGDLSRAPLSKALDQGDRRGFSNVLTDDVTSLQNADFIVNTNTPNLFFLPAGNANGIEFVADVSRQRLEAAVEALRKVADVIIFAMPPCDLLADASALSHYVDETCLVVSARTTLYRQIPTAHEVLHKAGARKISLILTDANVDEEPFAKRSAVLNKAD